MRRRSVEEFFSLFCSTGGAIIMRENESIKSNQIPIFLLFLWIYKEVKKTFCMHNTANRRWICNDVWMDILPFFDPIKLLFIMAPISDRLGALVDTHFDGKTTELTIWNDIIICKDIGSRAKVTVRIDRKFVGFWLPYRPLPNKIRFKDLQIEYIDHSVITFLRANKQIWDRSGSKLQFSVYAFGTDVQPIWDAFTRQIWPIFTTSIRHLGFRNGDQLDNLLRRISPTILTDSIQLHSIDLFSTDGLDSATANAGQALFEWLHTPTKDGQTKRLNCLNYAPLFINKWVANFKEAFLRTTTTSVSYKIRLGLKSTEIAPFELVNERTQEKLTLQKEGDRGNANVVDWLLKRCPNVEETAAVQWRNDGNSDANLKNIQFDFWGGCIGPLSPSAEDDEEEADQSNGN